MRVVSPVMPINLLRDLAPDAKVTWRRGTPIHPAINATSASLAAPFSGAARVL